MSNTEILQTSSGRIEHAATVVGVDTRRGIVTVQLSSSPDCQGCAAAKLCGTTGSNNNNILEVPSKIAGAFSAGQEVTLVGTETMHRKAVLLATVLPCIILITGMVLIYLLTLSQAAACLGGLGAMMAFFVVLWLLRKRIAREFVFSITVRVHPTKNINAGAAYCLDNSVHFGRSDAGITTGEMDKISKQDAGQKTNFNTCLGMGEDSDKKEVKQIK